MYGAYAVLMKKRVGNEDRVNMPLFFGFVGLFNLVFLWPGFIVLHFTGIETFELPPTGKIWTVVLVSLCYGYILSHTDLKIAELGHLVCERLLLGICDAPNNSSDCLCRSITNHPHVARWTDLPQFAISQFTVLGGRSSCGAFVPLHQS